MQDKNLRKAKDLKVGTWIVGNDTLMGDRPYEVASVRLFKYEVLLTIRGRKREVSVDPDKMFLTMLAD